MEKKEHRVINEHLVPGPFMTAAMKSTSHRNMEKCMVPEAKDSRGDDEHHETHSEYLLLRRRTECTGLSFVQKDTPMFGIAVHRFKRV